MKKRPGVGCFSAALTIVALACTPYSATAEPVNVVATIHPLAAIVDAVGGDAVRTSTLLPPGASPHAYDPVPSDLIRLSRADLLVTVGGGLDSWADRLQIAIESQPMVVTLTALNQGRSQHEEGDHHDDDHHDDPHLWLDPLFVADTLVPAIAKGIASAGTADTAALAARASALVQELHALDRRIRQALAGAGATEYIAFHNAWGHFAARYELDELGVLEGAGGEEPTPRAIAGIIRSARAYGVGAILVEPQLPPRVAEILAAEFDGSTVVVDPIGSPATPGRSGYIELMDYNGQAFTRALRLRKIP